MLSSLKSLLVVTNLYPVPWAPNRASFNKQQFDFLVAEGFDINIIILMPWTEWLKQRVNWQKQLNVNICPYFYLPKVGRRFVPFFQFLSLLFFLPWIKARQCDGILASWGFPDAVAVAMLNRYLKLPFFVKVHGTDINENSLYQPRRKLISKWLNQAKTIFCASQALGNTLIESGISKEKICVNYNGVNPDIFFPIDNKPAKKRLVFVGSLIPTKGINELMQAFLFIQKQGIEIEVDILGSGPMQSQLIEFSEKNNLTECFRIRGSLALHEVASYIRNANLLVLPSYREGVPNVVLESFASGTPVISTRVGGIPEVVSHETGLLVEPRSTQALADGIIEGLNKNWLQEDILAHAKKFDWQTNVTNVVKAMES